MPLQDLADLEAYRASLKEVNMYISQVENIVSTKLETTSRFADPQEEYKTSRVRSGKKRVFVDIQRYMLVEEQCCQGAWHARLNIDN